MRRDEFRKAFFDASDRVHTYAVWMIRNREDARDIAQEAFLRLWQRCETVATQSARAWLLRTVHRLCVDRIRQRTRRQEVSLSMLPIDSFVDADATTDWSPDGDLRGDVIRAVVALSPEDRAVVVLREVMGMSYGDMGEVLAQPVSTVKVRLHRARKRLRCRLEPLCEKRSVR